MTSKTWTAPKHPGDAVRLARFVRDDGEIGDVRIQFYGPTTFRVSAFMPGVSVFLPGDTPKCEPDQHHWCSDPLIADAFFDLYLQLYQAMGWVMKEVDHG